MFVGYLDELSLRNPVYVDILDIKDMRYIVYKHGTKDDASRFYIVNYYCNYPLLVKADVLSAIEHFDKLRQEKREGVVG